MKLLLIGLMFLFGAQAHAWDVNCGDRTIYYASGAILMSSGGTFYYPTGGILFSSGGTAYYASGGIMKSAGDTIYHASGGILKSAGGTYYYPNGGMARSAGGTLYRPDGSTTQLPFSMDLDLGQSVTAEVLVANNSSSDSNIEMVIPAGSGERLELSVTAKGIVCTGLANETKVTVKGSAGTAVLTVKPGHNANAIAEAVQRVLNQ